MVESFFGLARRPFCVVANLDCYVPTHACQQAIDHSVRCVLRAEGPSVIIAAAGLGKSICAMKIAQKLREVMQVVFLSSSQLCTRRALLQTILYHLGEPYQATGEGALRIQLQQRLTQPASRSQQVVLVVDEAQTLSTKLLEEIRILTNTLSQGKPVVHLVLIGTLKLEDTLSHPHMESLNQRIVSRQYLAPLSHQETLHYIRCKIELAGADPSSVFEPAAMEAIYRASDGVPRLIEQLADQAILQSGLESKRPITASCIGSVWSQVHQLPNPWSTSESTAWDSPTPELKTGNSRRDISQEDPSQIGVGESSSTFEDDDVDSLGSGSSVEFGLLDEEPEAVNLFQSFIEDPVEDIPETPESVGESTEMDARPAAASVKNNVVAINALDETFRQLIRDLNLAAIELLPREHAFMRAEQSSKLAPKMADSFLQNGARSIENNSTITTSPREMVGVSVDGDDRDMIVVIEEQDWVNPFAIR